ncbi:MULTISPECIES: FAD-dependent 5-carboxymethylaminomethyl-2-thiouridine(34) oxidoreductase MnmC [unclassified Massilia]|uniref:FAD-dependent 5-carboxymethylaminomethyl-2-thiouridine(34) oxidoreductase MnmC n=1 Tax=unclassified Massilia TaxID=2609279 RepID=UPI0017800800|nr:FAD-dependent 5-carboxymethylaminomethyl-2-thiouridine(34) oxidoreductase MnmC [Massilia sp. CFBP 13647]MBD8673255.1 FAD-dependent 5-carboxymethylaminomethyl-2-thiouridine(34) oxidoreductase MnmC [Massilia sp. CFBP 13721]
MNPARFWQGRKRYTVFDTAYGNGARAAALIESWRHDPERPARLHIVALADGMLPGFHRIPQADDAVTLDLVSAPLDAALAQLAARIDFVQLHGLRGPNTGFARALARLAAGDARLAFDWLEQEQVAALMAQGFVFDKGGARFASLKPRQPLPAVPQRHAIVIGAGLAGCAAAERLCARGWEVTLVERHAGPAGEASGNLAGIFMPLLSKDDNIPTRLTRAAYLYALRYWDTLGGIGNTIEGAACGVMQLARDAGHAAASRAIASGGTLPRAFAEWLEAEKASELLGLPVDDGAWLFRQGGWARPGSVCEAMLAACGARLTRRFGAGSVTLVRAGDEWEVRGAGGTIARAATVVLAGGAGSTRFAQAARLPLSQLRGQVTHLDAATLPQLPFVLCREAYLTPAAGGVACAGATYDLDADPQLRAASQQENLERLRALVARPEAGAGAPLAGRVGFRSVAPDRLPLVGALPDFETAGATERLRDVPRHPGLYGLLGYASRGLIWAPLCAELLVSRLENAPLPLEAALVDALDPARFVLRARRTGRGPAPFAPD